MPSPAGPALDWPVQPDGIAAHAGNTSLYFSNGRPLGLGDGALALHYLQEGVRLAWDSWVRAGKGAARESI
jgi:hypothetical protein